MQNLQKMQMSKLKKNKYSAPVMSFLIDFTAKGNNDYDLAVIGGGSGGLACAKEGKDGFVDG